ncbi:MAG: hypothetical protein JST00_28735 [Deltaproteobacteria bacterium]|nr:hypothetical protein [Deltaproteobacteria bacterium]
MLRSSLVKKSRDVSPAPAAAVVADPFALAPTVPLPPFGVSADDAPNTVRDGVEIHVDAEPVRLPYDSSPSTNDLLQRAAALGPARMTWESIVLPNDPVLHEKRTPHVAERRARLTRVVKGALAACIGVCVVALAVSAISGGTETEAKAATPTAKTVPSKGVVPVEALSIARHGKAAPASVAQARPAAPFTPVVIARAKRR